MNKKRLLVFFTISLLLASFIFSINLASAQNPPTGFIGDPNVNTDEKAQTEGYANLQDYYSAFSSSSKTTINQGSSSSLLTNFRNLAFVDLWLKGYNSTNFSLAGEFVKTLLLILLIILVYSSFSYAGFLGEREEFSTVRLILSIIIGLLATFLISTDALLSSLVSFTALGTAIWIFLPILVLTFFTILVSSSAVAFGMFFQKILWIVYSVYTFISGIIIFFLAQSKGGSAVAQLLTTYLINPLYGVNSVVLGNMKVAADAPTAILLIVVSILVFYFAVIKGDEFVEYLAKEKRRTDIIRQKDELERQSTKRKLEAEDTRR